MRHPLEVAASLEKRNGMPIGAGLLLWLRHVLEAEARSRDLPRAVVHYDRLLEDWRPVAAELAARFGAALPARPGDETAAQIDGFLNKDLRHHQDAGLDAALAALPEAEWIAPVHQAFRGAEIDRDALDLVRRDLERSERLYGAGARARLAQVRKAHALDLEDRTQKDREEARQLAAFAGNFANSTSWRVTAPLRRATQFITDFRQLPPADRREALRALLALRRPQAIQRLEDRRTIATSGLWDARFYVEQHPEAAAGDPLDHFLDIGAARGHDPRRWFDMAYYIEQNRAHLAGGANPLLDYIRRGAWNGASPHRRFDNASYLAEHPQLAVRFTTPFAHFLHFGTPYLLDEED